MLYNLLLLLFALTIYAEKTIIGTIKIEEPTGDPISDMVLNFYSINGEPVPIPISINWKTVLKGCLYPKF